MISLFAAIIIIAIITGVFAYFASQIPIVPPFVPQIIWVVGLLCIVLDVAHYFGVTTGVH